MNTLEQLTIEQACTRLIHQFAIFNDQGRFNELADLFTSDAQYARPIAPDVLIEGRANILAAFASRPQERVGRHIIGNVVIDVQSAQQATGICYVLLYSGSVDNPAGKFGLQATPPQLMGEYHDEFVLTPAGWRFQLRKGRIIFSA